LKESSITFKEASEIIDYIKGNTKTLGTSTHRAIDLLIKSNKPSITTYCPNMNEMLGGGVQSGCLTEFCLNFNFFKFLKKVERQVRKKKLKLKVLEKHK
jgi:hypothetical protein